MTTFFKKNQVHIVIWLAMSIYLVLAPTLHTYFFIKQGKPTGVNESLPTETEQIRFKVDGLDLIIQEGQEVYRLWGWAFSTLDVNMSPEMYEREILVVSSSNQVYAFSTNTVIRPGVQEAFKDLNMKLRKSGFAALISRDVLPPGEYRLGIVFRDPSTGQTYYTDKPKRILVRTPNSLSLLK